MATLDPAKLTPKQMATVLSKAGGQSTEQQIREDIAAGAPTNADGTLHLVHYAAWLASVAG